MTSFVMLGLALAMFATAFLSGLFGMAGGMVLIGILLAVLPLPAAMALHAVTQMASNGWRAALWWRHIRPGAAAFYLVGCALALGLWSVFRYVPNTATALLFLGLTPFGVYLLPERLKPNPARLADGIIYGGICMTLLLLTGVAGPMLDLFFLGGKLDRREIVATKALCQVFGHFAKLVYFGGIIESAASVDASMMIVGVAMSILGTTAARRFLEAMSDTQFRTWATRIITSIAGYYVVHGSYLLLAPAVWKLLR